MPANKNAQLRYSIIDSCLQRTHRIWTFEGLLEAVNNEYQERYGTGKGISPRTLRSDIADLKLDGKSGYNAPIEYIIEKGYHYTVPGFSIFQSPITLDDLPILQQVLTNLRQLLGLGLTEDLQELVQRLEYRLSQSAPSVTPSIIQFESLPSYVGLPWLGPLYQAIRDHHTVALTYQPFQAGAASIQIVHPHLLKQFNHRWFLLGVEEGQTRLSTFALDRIQALELKANIPYRPISVEPSTYFQHIIGSAVPENATVETIHLRFSPARAPYIRTKPIHHSQQIVSNGADGMEIVLQLMPTRELLSQLLSYGADVQVLAPLTLQQAVKLVLRNSLEAYNLLK